jgi:hypothetical protein
MGDAFPKAGGLGIFVIVVDGVLIARQPSEEQKVCIGQRLGRDRKCVADLKILQIFGRRCYGSSCPLIMPFFLEGRRNRGTWCVLLALLLPRSGRG